MSSRNIVDVINQIKEVSQDKDLTSSLNDLLLSVRYTAPEAMHLRWESLSEILEDNIIDPSQGWHFKIFEIVQGKTTIQMLQEIFEYSEDGLYVNADDLPPLVGNYTHMMHKRGFINVAENSILLCHKGKVLLHGQG